MKHHKPQYDTGYYGELRSHSRSQPHSVYMYDYNEATLGDLNEEREEGVYLRPDLK